MKCRKPFAQGVMRYGCQQCMPCRINRRRLWTHRIMLESLKHGDNSFLTLTYDDKHLPEDRNLRPKDLQDFIKRLRYYGYKFRYFACGEYGEEKRRPHYHMALFGVSAFELAGETGKGDPLNSIWGHGYVFAGDINFDSAHYVAGYVTKKLTKEDLDGRVKEFARMSLKPGIGAVAMDDVASILLSDVGSRFFNDHKDVPVSLKHGRKSWPLGRYLRRKLREKVGWSSSDVPYEALKEVALEMRFLFEGRLVNEGYEAYKTKISAADYQSGLNAEAKLKLYDRKGEL